MDNFEKKVVEKYLDGTASNEEAKIALAFLQTVEGQAYLENLLDRDLNDRNRLTAFRTGLPDPERTLKSIRRRTTGINKPGFRVREKKVRRSPALLAVAACIALIIGSIVILDSIYVPDTTASTDIVTSVVHLAGEGQQKILTLSDGSVIRLNSHSRLEVPEYFDREFRNVKLEGEAFFDIVHNPEHPFTVQTDDAGIRVLGTSFNVRSETGSGQMYVAVLEGRVSVEPLGMTSGEILEENMIGVYNRVTNRLHLETTDVNNYLSWIHGRIVFDETPFRDVVRLLENKYGLQNVILDERLYDLRITADFSERSADNVLEVIADGLEITFELEGSSVRWSH